MIINYEVFFSNFTIQSLSKPPSKILGDIHLQVSRQLQTKRIHYENALICYSFYFKSKIIIIYSHQYNRYNNPHIARR